MQLPQWRDVCVLKLILSAFHLTRTFDNCSYTRFCKVDNRCTNVTFFWHLVTLARSNVGHSKVGMIRDIAASVIGESKDVLKQWNK